MDNEQKNSELLETQADVSELQPTVEKTPKKSGAKIVVSVVLFVLVILGAFIFLDYTNLKDYFVGLGYEPSPAMSEIKSSLELTDRADLIFKASFPTLESEDDFNQDCDSHDSEISVLGCFASDRIYVYNIESSEVPGILESTTAHELLHAIWSRLKGTEKAQLTPILQSVYEENVETLEETLESYAEDERLDELYVRIGTQIKNLPTELEEHYSKYFSNRAKVVGFYESYISPFNELRKQIDALGEELEKIKQEIDAETAEYESRSGKFNTDVAAFNSCANTVNCFTERAFYARRAELVAEEENLNTMFENLNLKIDEYNLKVEEYNSNVFKSNNLQRIINSNAPPAETTSGNE